MPLYSWGFKSLEKIASPLGILKDLNFRTKKGYDRIADRIKIQPWKNPSRRKCMPIKIGSFFYSVKVSWVSYDLSGRVVFYKDMWSPWSLRRGDRSSFVNVFGGGIVYENQVEDSVIVRNIFSSVFLI